MIYSCRNRGFLALPIMAYAAIGAGVIILALGAAVKVQTSRLDAAKQEYATFKDDVKAKGDERERRTAETIARQKRSADEAEKRSQRAVADIRSKYDGLRKSGSGSGKLPAIPSTAPVADAAARDSRLLEVLRIAEEQTRRLEELQGWVRDQAKP